MDRWTDEKNAEQPALTEPSHLLFHTEHVPAESFNGEPLNSEPFTDESFMGEPFNERLLDGGVFGGPPISTPRASHRLSRADRRRRRRRRRLVPLVAFLVIVVMVVVSYVLVGQVRDRFDAPDYSGNGQGLVTIRVNAGDGASDIGSTLVTAGVVKSTRAFVNAANKSGQSRDIDPGVYQVRLHSSGAAALAAIQNPANRLVYKVTIPEGSTYRQVLQIVATQTHLSATDLSAALANVGNLGIPAGFTVKSGEGFLFPATYDFDPGSSTTANSVLQTMVSKFSAEASSLNLAAGAKALKLSAYQLLIIASIAQAETKFDSDVGKVARVILNRLADGGPLRVDATSAYAAKLAGKDPASITYATYNTPYNTYTHVGLPPTPIGNPGAAAISGALNPPAGNWLYYVNIDAAGHLGFFSDDASFEKAAATCKAQNWGCG